MAAYAFEPWVLDGFVTARPLDGTSEEAAEEQRELCCDAAAERWSPRSPQFLRQTLTDRPPFRKAVVDPKPLDDAWTMLCATFGAVQAPPHDLPWWLEPFARDAFVRVTPAAELQRLVTVINGTDMLAQTLPLLPMMDCRGFEEDLSSMCAFIADTAAAHRSLLVFHWTS